MISGNVVPEICFHFTSQWLRPDSSIWFALSYRNSDIYGPKSILSCHNRDWYIGLSGFVVTMYWACTYITSYHSPWGLTFALVRRHKAFRPLLTLAMLDWLRYYKRCIPISYHILDFYPRPVLAFGYCRCLRVCVSVCPSITSLSVR